MRARVFIIAVGSDEMRRQTWAIPCTNEGLAVSSSESSRRSISRDSGTRPPKLPCRPSEKWKADCRVHDNDRLRPDGPPP